MRSIARQALLVAIAAACCGCGGDDLPRQPLSGKVTLDGAPLDGATITFTPADQAGRSTPAVAQVSGGEFSIGRADGTVPGSYKVSVSAAKEGPAKPSRGRKKETDSVTGEEVEAPTTALQESLPARYNAKTELTADVTEAGPNEFTFDLTSH